MTDTFLSLKEAESYTGKSRSTLRRFVEAITKPEDHPDRVFVDPSVSRVAELHAGNHPFSWRVSTTLLDREFKNAKKQLEQPSEPTHSGVSKEIIDLLQQSISILKVELDEKNKQITGFQERQRETNVLLQQTTEKLMLLSDGAKHRSTPNDEAITVNMEDNGKGNRTSQATAHSRKTIWQRLHTKIF